MYDGRKSRPKGHVAFKLDLEKAYDRLEWSFIKETLEFFQIPPRLIQLIMNMLSSTCFHIMWNGTPLPAIVPSRGIRQGDPLSPYLFILCLERLSILLEEAVQELFILLLLGVKLKFPIFSLPMISFFSLKRK